MPQRAGYTFHETLHESSRSMLIRATRQSDGATVVLKLPGSDYLDRRRTLEIHREYAIARRVEGDGIIRVLGIEDLSDRVALVLEDFGGRSLRHLLDERGPLDVETFLDYALRICKALEHIHRHGVIHKDIKPQNIIANPETGVVKIADFSISAAIAVEATTPETPTFLTGTLAYMAPEQTGRMNRGVDYRADFYALGATFFELLTNRRPFESDTPLELLHAHVAQMPPSPRELVPSIPEPVAAIILKLLAKDPAARYQSTWGLIADLEECQRRIKAKSPLTVFPLGVLDRTVQFRLPQGLYGRAADVEVLEAAHARAVKDRGELLLISGSAGIGKSTLVNELHRVTAASRGRFTSGKCDQLRRGVPFDAIHEALKHLVRLTLAEGEAEVEQAREQLGKVLGEHAPVLVEAVPELRLLLGEQPPPAPLPAAESRNRLNRVLTQALQSFATPERPLVLFLDDLQWVDVATLALLQELVRNPDCRHLLPVGAWRDTEVSDSHPLTVMLGELRAEGTPIHELHLGPISPEDVARMVREATGADTGRALGLGQLIHARTGGNPFSVREFLRFLHDQQLIQFNARTVRWEWDLPQIEAREIPSDIAGLMADEVQRLPKETCELLQRASCLGMVFSFRDLVVVHGEPSRETAQKLWSALEQGFVLPLSKDYLLLDPSGDTPLPPELEVSFRFLHDRVRQAAYALLPASERAERHLQVGLRLLEHARATGALDERAFVILPHLAHAPEKIAPALRLELADIHLKAGRRAKASGAYRTAVELFRAGGALLGPSGWEREYDRAFALQLELAECCYLAGDLDAAAEGFSTLLAHARAPAQKASVIVMQVTLASLTSQHTEALRIGLEGLRLLGMEVPATVDPAALSKELDAVAERLRGRKARELLELPQLTDPGVELSINLLASIAASAYMADQSLFALLVLRIVRLSLEHGNGHLSAFGYVIYGVLLAAQLDDPTTGREFGQLAVELSARLRDPMLHARVRYLRAGLIDHWTHNARAGVAELTEAYKGLMETGDWIYAGHCLIVRLWRRVAVGDPLPEILSENRRFIEFLEAKKGPDLLQMFLSAHRTLLALTGSEDPTPAPPSSGMGNTAMAYLRVGAAERLYLLRQPAEALAEAEEAVPLLPFTSGLFHLATHALYHALSAAAVYPEANEGRGQKLLRVMEQHRTTLAKYARRAPENFAPHHLLVSAELLRVRGQDHEALAEYERAIAAARTSGMLGVEAIACEQAFRFLTTKNRRLQGSAYLLEALYAYERWGATAKARLLAAEQASLLLSHGSALRRWDGKPRSGATTNPASKPERTGTTHPSTSDSITESFDMTSAMKASQAISSEILFPQLVANLIHVVMESAGAQRGVLVLRRGQEYFVEAKGEMGQRAEATTEPQPMAESDELCQAIIHQVLQSGAHVMLDDASATDAWRADPYVSSHKVRSVLCAPIRHRGQVLGLFYLENNLTPGAFNTSRLKVLEMLTSQAAISIENAQLYQQLEDYSHTLEDRVADRTAELHSKNAELHRALETLKAMQAQIVTQEKLASLGSLTSGIAHELKNPLNFVSNFAAFSNERVRELRDLLPGTSAPTPAQREEYELILGELEMNTRKIREHGQRAVSIIDGMLQHARGKRGDKRATNVNLLVEDVVRLVHHGLKAKSARRNVVIETAFDATVPDVQLVSDDIRRVVLNLVDNACYSASEKALQPGSAEQARVKVSTRWTGKDVEIRVRDNGKGIPPSLREKLFTPFFTTKPAGEGTGLGLSISHEIVVVSLGGKLSVESEEGRYAEFIVVLPGGGQRASPPV